jgi:hypothetical protein
MKRLIPAFFAMTLAPMLSFGQTTNTIVDDTFSDNNRADTGTPALQANWWYSTASSAIETTATDPGTYTAGPSLGFVTGANGRGIAGTYASQTLGIGDTITAMFTFATPATVDTGGNKAQGFKIGLFDTTGHTTGTANLLRDITASSSAQNVAYNNLNGYMLSFDVNTAGSGSVITLSKRSNASSGQLMNNPADFTQLAASSALGYQILASSTYTGLFSITYVSAGTLSLTGSLYSGAMVSGSPVGSPLGTFTTTDTSATDETFGMLGFHALANAFGSSNALGAANNGIDFSEAIINDTVAATPEPTSLALFSGGALLSLGVWGKRKLGRKS